MKVVLETDASADMLRNRSHHEGVVEEAKLKGYGQIVQIVLLFFVLRRIPRKIPCELSYLAK